MKKQILKWLALKIKHFRISLLLRTSQNVFYGKPKIMIPTEFVGNGKIVFGNNVTLGFYPSPYFHSVYNYIEARFEDALIEFGNNIVINNGLVLIAEKSKVIIKDNVLMGTNVEIINSDFHGIHPEERNSGKHSSKPVLINENVFIGSNVKICKGVEIGKNSIISNGSVVFESIPENSIAQGNPAKVIKKIIL